MAVIVTLVVLVTADVGMMKYAVEVLPAATVTVAGGWATDGLELVRVTTAPPAGATSFIKTVLNLVDTPPVVVFAISDTFFTPKGSTTALA